MTPVFKEVLEPTTPINLPNVLDRLIDIFADHHFIAKSAHEEMIAMSHSDEDIGEYFKNFEMDTTEYFVDVLKHYDIPPSNPYEKVHIAFNMIENFCHEIAYHQHKNLDYDFMKKEVVNIVSTMLLS